MRRRFTVPLKLCSVLFVLTFLPYSLRANNPDKLQEQIHDLNESLNQFQKKLNQAQNKKQNTKHKLRQTKSRESSILEIIDQYNNQLERVRERLKELKRKENKARENFREAKKRLAESKKKLNQHKSTVARRLRYAYMKRQISSPEILVRASSVSELMTRMKYFREVLNVDKNTLESYESARKSFSQRKQKRKKSLNWLNILQKRVKKTITNKKQLLQKRKSVLDKIQNKKSLYRKKLQELENQQNKLKEKVFRLQEQYANKKVQLKKLKYKFGRQKGNLPWPVDSRDIIRPFGNWRRGKNEPSFENDGIDISVENGARVKAVAPGKVLYSRSYTGMGQVVIMRHGGDYTTLYGSLLETNVQQGDELDQGAIIGRAGETSGFREPRLYFQIFFGREILNPSHWLR